MKKVVFFFLGVITLMSVAVASLWNWLPTEQEIKGCMTTKMYHVELCPGSKNYVPLKQISQNLQKAIILTEDSTFFTHNGFDWGSIEKNAREGWESGSFRKGGSTITQQLAKNMFLTGDRTLIRKGVEAIITDRIENTLSKKEILERYLNVVEFGKNIFGVKDAAKYYFKKTPADLSVVESAFLALVLPNPVKYSMSYYKKELTPFAKKRLTQIIENMYRYHRISLEEYEQAMQQAGWFFQSAPPMPAEIMEAIEAEGGESQIIEEHEQEQQQENFETESEQEAQ